MQNASLSSVSLQEAPEKLISAIQRAHGGLKDDTSVIVLDLLPPEKDFPDIAGTNSKSKATGGFMCCAACVPLALLHLLPSIHSLLCAKSAPVAFSLHTIK